jgi:hypothetical protein
MFIDLCFFCCFFPGIAWVGDGTLGPSEALLMACFFRDLRWLWIGALLGTIMVKGGWSLG